MLAKPSLLFYPSFVSFMFYRSTLALVRLVSYTRRMAKMKGTRSQSIDETTVLYIRNTPIGLARKLRAAAALAGYRGVPDYVIEVLMKHIEELEQKGKLPRG